MVQEGGQVAGVGVERATQVWADAKRPVCNYGSVWLSHKMTFKGSGGATRVALGLQKREPREKIMASAGHLVAFNGEKGVFTLHHPCVLPGNNVNFTGD